MKIFKYAFKVVKFVAITAGLIGESLVLFAALTYEGGPIKFAKDTHTVMNLGIEEFEHLESEIEEPVMKSEIGFRA